MLNDILHNARTSQRLSIAELTDALNKRYTITFSKSAIQRYEKGADIPPSRLFVLADYFGWSLDSLAKGYVDSSRRK
ncbi:MAG: helix-turn-helix domain-containing protein [Furfurilactobacillus sp.]|jgi:transcriptional regulator with XRE-family HTH domain|uniref:HTH cro/C1-type domain-containing protein n=2 Tax=Furfurilactobacillus TaxID=2767882 RepID=A0A0R1RJ60_9LACO|nr:MULTISPECIES: helix-turn-helix transcriptional regulator [Furfurilactobacillus]KRL54309.1 hypothetical protein FD35_GL002646 [Furfurilactobacillus rossiae DSM 15814]MCF6161357.1 helix-turn-helix domain-containing protein [Furfurilactobacillus milii]MCF6163737.1 helix-turn-helix domain-containing protein [Furfurilactobacillus milii]MCF6419585.1 helix-turn-helix domain-containing protein [Furfurilactobacillus milii]MCH4011716.1 helix-turn-helix domain-containing protein [Furfurilactobacillus 